MPDDAARLASGHGIHRASLTENDMARAHGHNSGLIKVVTNAKGQILGASLVGPGAADLAGVLALAIDQGTALEALADMPLPHSSLMASLVALGENRLASRSVSSFARRRGAFKRLLRL